MAIQEERQQVCRRFGAGAREAAELLAYNTPLVDPAQAFFFPTLPFPDEPFVQAWEAYEEESRRRGLFVALREALAQFQFPVRQGISQTPAYRDATRRGRLPGSNEATGLHLRSPQALRLRFAATLAGRLPVLETEDRDDFARLVSALAHRNEPFSVPPTMGASLITGLNNWDRVNQYRRRWEQEHPREAEAGGWPGAFRVLRQRKELYRDRVMLLTQGPYSGTDAASLGLAEAEWYRHSTTIREAHESAHYFTLRACGVMRDRAADELLGDYAGLRAAVGRYRADWARRFLGVGGGPGLPAAGRLSNYRGDPPLSDAAFAVLAAMVAEATESLERFDQSHGDEWILPARQVAMRLALLATPLEWLAAPGGDKRLSEQYDRFLEGLS